MHCRSCRAAGPAADARFSRQHLHINPKKKKDKKKTSFLKARCCPGSFPGCAPPYPGKNRGSDLADRSALPGQLARGTALQRALHGALHSALQCAARRRPCAHQSTRRKGFQGRGAHQLTRGPGAGQPYTDSPNRRRHISVENYIIEVESLNNIYFQFVLEMKKTYMGQFRQDGNLPCLM